MPEIKLPLGEAVRRSFSFVFNHMEAFIKISLLWGILIVGLDALENFPSLCLSDAKNCNTQNSLNLYLWLMFIGEISVAVTYIVYVIERPEYKSFFNLHFGKKELKYVWALLKLVFAGLALSMIVGVFIGSFMRLIGQDNMRQLSVLFSVISFFVIIMFLSRYILVFPAIALNNAEINFEKSYQLTKGNINAIFWGAVVISLPMALANVFVAGLYYAVGVESWVLKLVFSFILIGLNLLNDVLKASFLAHIYQYFIYFYNHNQPKGEAE